MFNALDNQKFLRLFLALSVFNTILAVILLFLVFNGSKIKIPNGEIEIQTPKISAVKQQNQSHPFVPEERLLEFQKEVKSKSKSIVSGKVLSLKSEWNEDRTYIWTFAEIQVSKWFKNPAGESSNIITVKIPDGVVGDMRQITDHGVAVLDKDEEVLLFLGEETYRGKRYFNVQGGDLGKHTVRNARVTGLGADMPIADFLNSLD